MSATAMMPVPIVSGGTADATVTSVAMTATAMMPVPVVYGGAADATVTSVTMTATATFQIPDVSPPPQPPSGGVQHGQTFRRRRR
jgi:hypothetical protein